MSFCFFSSLALIGFLDMDYLVGRWRWRERCEGDDGDGDDNDDGDE